MEKLKAGISDGAQIRTLILDTVFVNYVTQIESEAWLSIVSVVQHLLGNDSALDYSELIAKIL